MNDFTIPIELLSAETARQPYPLLFATISGAHLYGFPSDDSDYDLRGIHVLPTRDLLGLYAAKETIEVSRVEEGVLLDLVTHDARKFFMLILKRNGDVLEQLYSPLVLHTTSEHEELKQIAQECITRYHAYHYLGFAKTKWELFQKEQGVKPLLYMYRVLLTGIHLMRSGQIEANLVALNEIFEIPYIPDLIIWKTTGPEKAMLRDTDIDFHRKEYERLAKLLEEECLKSHLPENSTGKEALSDLLVRLRMASIEG